MSSTCEFCACQEFWSSPTVVTQGPLDTCLACSHTRIEHGPIPPALDCAAEHCDCALFALTTRESRLFSCLCRCRHPWGDASGSAVAGGAGDPVRLVTAAPIPSSVGLPLTSPDPKPKRRPRAPQSVVFTTRILLFVADPVVPFVAPRGCPGLASLGLAPDFNVLSFNPVLYSALVSHMDELHLVIEITLSDDDTLPPNLLRLIMKAVKTHILRQGNSLDTSGAQLPPQVPEFRLLAAAKPPARRKRDRSSSSLPGQPSTETVHFVHNDVYEDTFQLSSLTRAGVSVLNSKHILVCPGHPAWHLTLPVDDALVSPSDDVNVSCEPGDKHPCSTIRAVEYYSSPAAPVPTITPGRCRAICSPSLPTRLPGPSHHERHPPSVKPDLPAAYSDSEQGVAPGHRAAAHDDDDWFPDSDAGRRRSASPVRSYTARSGSEASSRPSLPRPRRGFVRFSPPAGFTHPAPGHAPATPSRRSLHHVDPFDRFLQDIAAQAEDPSNLIPDLQLDVAPTPPSTRRLIEELELDLMHDSSDSDTQSVPDADAPAVVDGPAAASPYADWPVFHAGLVQHLDSTIDKVIIHSRCAELTFFPDGDPPTVPVGRVMSHVLLYLLSAPSPTDRDLNRHIQSEFNTPKIACRSVTLQNLLCFRYNDLYIGKSFGQGPERAIITQTLKHMLDPSDPARGPTLWRKRGDYYYPCKSVPVDPTPEESAFIRACGVVAVWALLRLGYIPYIDPVFLFLILCRHFLRRSLRDPAVLGRIFDKPFLALAARDCYPVLQLFPDHFADPVPALHSSKPAETLHARLWACGVSPTAPRAENEHVPIALTLISTALFDMNLPRLADPPEWDAFFDGFNLDLTFGRRKAYYLSTAFYNFLGTATEDGTITALKHLVIGLCCAPPEKADVAPRLRVAPPQGPLDHLLPLLEKIHLLVDNYVSGVGHPPSLVTLLGLDPAEAGNALLRLLLFVRAACATPFLAPAEPGDIDYPITLYLSLPERNDAEGRVLVHDVHAFKFATCGFSVVFFFNDALRRLVDESIDLLSSSPSASPPVDTPFGDFLHSQLVHLDHASFNHV
ncbi:hypothetical protein AURDEDRAFT_159382 [Auricularia subglabra TFB-10046 SS5]|nr:hypothetical protein AURDEDRAFT_159382 [Auricularia subglabra TFB-10046 SS5]